MRASRPHSPQVTASRADQLFLTENAFFLNQGVRSHQDEHFKLLFAKFAL